MLGERIKERRKALGLTQTQLAERLHVTNKAVSKWETEDANPDLSLLPALCEALQISADRLLGMAPTSEDTPTEPTPAPIAEPPKMTGWDKCKCGFAVAGVAVTAFLAFLFLLSAILALDRKEVANSTGNADDQPMLIVFSTVLMLVFSFLCVRLVKRLTVIQMTFRLSRYTKLRQLAAENGMRLYYDLPREQQKDCMRNFRKTVWPLFVLMGCCILLMAVLYAFRWAIWWNPWIDILLYLLGVGGTYGIGIILFFVRRSYFKSIGIYI
ncbi:MAG: helix-turn-helix transcriptional regulator [Clostridia bacterium]|nr:helix-turn-helix transcriptional regulator [Clostridia bacterium]